MSLKKLVAEVAKLCGQEGLVTTSVDLSQLGISSMHSSVKSYFSGCVPNQSVDWSFYRLSSASKIKSVNTEFLPSCYIIQSGFVTFASEFNGDAIVVDVFDGRVHLVSHEIFSDDGISNFGSNKPIPITRETILENSENTFKSIAEFFKSWRNQLVELHKKRDDFLTAAAADPNAIDEFGNTLLIQYIREGNLKSVKKEITRGADIEKNSGEERTALGEAVAFKEPKIVEYLIKCGANINAVNKERTTPLMIAAKYASLECIKILVQSNADRKAVDVDGRTALKQLCVVHGTPAMKKLLKP